MSKNKPVFSLLNAFFCVILPLSFVLAEEFVYDSQGKRNPFIPLVTPDGRYQKLEADETKAADETLKLEGIMYDKFGISYAVVNGVVARIGDMVGEYQILKIEEKKVMFMREGLEKIMELKKEGS
jgi:hypothetical protein